MSKVNLVLDATMLDMLQLCEARFNYRFNLNKESAVKARPLDRGTVVHTGLEKYYESLRRGDNYNDSVEVMLNAARFELAKSSLAEEEYRPILRTLEENVDYWRVEDQKFQVLEVEKSFMYTLFEDDEVRIMMIGKIDLLVADNIYERLPVDHKSYDRDYPVRRLSNQFMNYCYATGSHFLRVNKIGFQKTLKSAEKFKRPLVSYDPLMLEEWKQNVIKWVFKYLTDVAEGYWPMNFTSCDKFNRPCEYLEICESSGAEAKLFKLTANLRSAEPWDVSKILEKK